METGVVVGDFAHIRKRIFGDDGFDAGFDGGGLKSNSRTHRNAERVVMADVLG